MNFEQLIRFAVEQGASDLHLQAGSVPQLRITGTMRSVESPPLTREELRQFICGIAPLAVREDFDHKMVEGFDFSHALEGLARFRCNLYSHLGKPGMVMRVIKLKIPSIEELNLPGVVREIALARRGLTLLTGTTGSGKSTTLAAMVDLINSTSYSKIITIEDPVEYVHQNKKSLIAQLELGLDTPSFDHGMRQALRQDPDVILVGELRDTETVYMALRAADTGHQVLATVHSANAAQTIERIMAMIPPAQQALAISQLALAIEGVISQRLAVTRDGKRRPAVEVLRGGPVTAKFILERRIGELSDYIGTGQGGMQKFDQHLLDLYNQDAISGTEAMKLSTHPEAIALGIRGIRHSGTL
jgi:twitching motility protein PilT